MFYLDIFATFFKAYQREDFGMEHDLKTVAVNYLKGWFAIDLMAVIPFDVIMNDIQSIGSEGSSAAATNQYNKLVRVTRIGKLYRLVKITKLLRVLKMFKGKGKLFM